MGGKSRKSGQVSKRLIERLKQSVEKSNCGRRKPCSNTPSLGAVTQHDG